MKDFIYVIRTTEKKTITNYTILLYFRYVVRKKYFNYDYDLIFSQNQTLDRATKTKMKMNSSENCSDAVNLNKIVKDNDPALVLKIWPQLSLSTSKCVFVNYLMKIDGYV